MDQPDGALAIFQVCTAAVWPTQHVAAEFGVERFDETDGARPVLRGCRHGFDVRVGRNAASVGTLLYLFVVPCTCPGTVQ